MDRDGTTVCHALCGCPEHYPGLHTGDDLTTINVLRADLAWCVGRLEGLGHPAPERIQRNAGLTVDEEGT